MVTTTEAPSIDDVQAASVALRGAIVRTPTWAWDGEALRRRLPAGTRVVVKLEALQHTGSFKARAALLAVSELDPKRRGAGVTAVSAGNHAMAVAFAAARHGTTAKVVMPRSADPARVEGCRRLGAQVVLVEHVHAAFAEVERIVAEEGRTFVHPFEGETVARGTGTIALELLQDAPDVDAVIVPIGGGGLCGGIAAAIGQSKPECRVYGVEPEGADTMHRSFAAGSPQAIDAVRTIADSLGAPHAAPYSFALCRRYVAELAKIDDDAMRRAMALLFADLKLAVEPAGAAATAALMGPLRDRLAGKTVALVICGANLAPTAWAEHVSRGQALLNADAGTA
jgi:threonine dehydratase